MSSAAILKLLATLLLPVAKAIVKELYTTNAVCKTRYCINPIFPAMVEIPSMEEQRWVKYPVANISQWMNFCRPFVNYDPALPYVDDDAQFPFSALSSRSQAKVAQQDGLAAKTYFYHLSGMGLEAWDHQTPAEVSSQPERACARSVASMVCNTYFPKAFASLAAGQEVMYTRPCRNVCERYVQECSVQCCDDSVSCTWNSDGGEVREPSRTTQTIDGRVVSLQTGYAAFDGPSVQCTGS